MFYIFSQKTLFNCVTFQNKLLPVRIIHFFPLPCEKFCSKHRKGVPFRKNHSFPSAIEREIFDYWEYPKPLRKLGFTYLLNSAKMRVIALIEKKQILHSHILHNQYFLHFFEWHIEQFSLELFHIQLFFHIQDIFLLVH